jgi:hypothetical protein
MAGDGRLQALRDFAQSSIPGNAFELSAAFGSCSLERVKQPIEVILAVQILGHFATKEAAGDRVIGVAAQTSSAALFVYVNEQGTGIWAIEGADGMASRGHPSVYSRPGLWRRPSRAREEAVFVYYLSG